MFHGVLSIADWPTLAALWSDKGLMQLSFVRGQSDMQFHEAQAREFGSTEKECPAWLSETLEAYFAGEAIDPITLPVDLLGTPFQKRVWNALREVRSGQVFSYQEIAQRIGSPQGMRAVGLANGRNPVVLVVPCHRIVTASMTLGGYSAGLDLKQRLLALESWNVDARGQLLRGEPLDFLADNRFGQIGNNFPNHTLHHFA